MTESTTRASDLEATDVVLATVANDRRRTALRTLDAADGSQLPFDALADQVAERVRDPRAAQSWTEHRREVGTALYHVHLPKLEEHGMVVCDTDAMRVRSCSSDLGREALAIAEELVDRT